MTFGVDTIGEESIASTPAYSVDPLADPLVFVELGSSLPSVGILETAWVDVTHDFRGADIRRGRQSELAKVGAGTASLVLSNADRDYDPNHSASPHAAYLKPRRRLRVRTLYAGVWDDQFTGYVDKVTQHYEPPNEATARLECSDGFSVLSGADLPSSAYVAEVQADNPVALWRLNEPTGSTVVRDSVGGLHLDVFGAPGFGATTLVSREPGSATQITNGSTQAIWKNAAPLPFTGAPATIELVHRKIVGGSDGAMAGLLTQPLTQGALWLFVAGTLIAMQAVNGSNAQQTTLTTGVNLDDGLTHHIVGRWDATGALSIWVDGVNRTSGNPSLAPVAFTAATGIVHAMGTPPGIHNTSDHGTSQMVAMYNTALSDARIAVHAAQVATPWNNDTSGARIGRVLNAIGWPAADRNLDAGVSSLQSAALNMSALAHAQKVEETEAGLLFIDKSGKVRFRSRHAGFNLVSAATFGDANDGVELGYTSMEPYLSVFSIYNDVRVSRNEGTLQQVSDAASQAEYQRRTLTIDGLLNQTDTESYDRAAYMLNLYKDPQTRIDRLTIDPQQASPAAYFTQVLGRELGDQIVVKRRPQGVGSVITLTARIEGTTLTIAPKRWGASWNISPERAGDFLQLDDTDGPGLGFVRLAY